MSINDMFPNLIYFLAVESAKHLFPFFWIQLQSIACTNGVKDATGKLCPFMKWNRNLDDGSFYTIKTKQSEQKNIIKPTLSKYSFGKAYFPLILNAFNILRYSKLSLRTGQRKSC